MSNRHNGHGPLMQGQEFRGALDAAAEQGRQRGIAEARQAIMNAPVSIRAIDFLEDGGGKLRPFEPLAFPVAISRPGLVMVAGGMTTRLMVASQIFARLVDDEACRAVDDDECLDVKACARSALDFADVLIELEQEDRVNNRKKADEAPADSSVVLPEKPADDAGPAR